MTVTIDYLCPTAEQLEAGGAAMPVTSFQYSVDSGKALKGQLPRICFTVSKSYFVRVDTGEVVPFIYASVASSEFFLWTRDFEGTLQGKTLEFYWFIDRSDGKQNISIANFTVQFLGKNSLPFFDPPLTAFIQVHKTHEPTPWSM